MKYYSEIDYEKQYNAFWQKEALTKFIERVKEEFWQWRKFEIHLDRMTQPESVLKIIVLHGPGGNGRIMSLIASFLHEEGFEYIAPDLPGYGLTKSPKKENFEYKSWVECVADFVDHESAKDDRPVVLFGISLGGMLAYQVAARNKKVMAVITTNLADPRSQKVRDDLARNKFLSRVALPLGTSLRLITDYIVLPLKWLCKMDRVSNNGSFSAIYLNDELAGGRKVKRRFVRTFTEYKPDMEPHNFANCPFLFLHPQKDKWTTLNTNKPFYDKLKCSKNIVLLENCGHLPFEEPGKTIMRKEVSTFLKKLIGLRPALLKKHKEIKHS